MAVFGFACLELRAPHDPNGNPRRLYLVLDDEGCIDQVIDQGYQGRGALPAGLLPRGYALSSVRISASEYRELRQYGRQLDKTRRGE